MYPMKQVHVVIGNGIIKIKRCTKKKHVANKALILKEIKKHTYFYRVQTKVKFY